MISWEVVRHQVAIAGQVTDAQTGRALGGAAIKIIAAPATFVTRLVTAAKLVARQAALAAQYTVLDDPGASEAEKLAAAQTILGYLRAYRIFGTARPDLTSAAPDGLFYFLDLPDGPYTLSVSVPGAGERYGQTQVTTTVARDGDGNLVLAGADVALPPTSLSGQITGLGMPLALAEVRLNGSGEFTFSTSTGSYLLAGLETGQRTVQISAQGYHSVTQTVPLTRGTAQTLDFDLVPKAFLVDCQLWLKADALNGLTAGDPVDRWPDLSGQGADLTQTTGTQQPTYQPNVTNGRPTLRFDGVDDYLEHCLIGDEVWVGDFALFVVVAALSVGQPGGASIFNNFNNFGSGETQDTFQLGTNGGNPGRYRLRTTKNISIQNVTTDFVLLEVILSGTQLTAYSNGDLKKTNTLSSNEGNHFQDYLLGVNRNGDRFFHGDIAEVILYSRAFADDEREEMEVYLSNRYAISLV